MLKRDQTLKEIVKWIAKNPGINLYEIDHTKKKIQGVNRTTAMRKIKQQYKLVKRGLLRVEIGKRNAEKYWLTFKGLVFALNIAAIKPEEAHSIRLRHAIQLPKQQPEGLLGDIDFAPLFSHVEKEFSSYFYNILLKSAIDLTRVNDASLATFTGILAIFTLSELHRKHRDLIADYVKGKDYILPDGTVCKDFVHWFRRFKKSGLTFR